MLLTLLGSHPLKTAEMRAHSGLAGDTTAAAEINVVSLGVNQGAKIAQNPRLKFLSALRESVSDGSLDIGQRYPSVCRAAECLVASLDPS